MNPLEWDAPFWIVYVALFVIVSLRANGTYWLGRALVAGVRRSPRLARLTESPRFARAQRLIARYGAPVVTVSFVTMGFQTMALLAAGIGRMPLRSFGPAVVLGCLVWAAIFSTVGFVGFAAAGALWARSPALTIGLGGVLLAGLVAGILARRRTAIPG